MEWRARWKAATNTGSPLFDGPTTDWNLNQVALSFWFNFYDNIFEHPERPDLSVVNNDDLLDQWVEKKSKEMEDRARKNSRNVKTKGMPSAHDHDEVIIFDEEEWEEVLEEESDKEYEIEA